MLGPFCHRSWVIKLSTVKSRNSFATKGLSRPAKAVKTKFLNEVRMLNQLLSQHKRVSINTTPECRKNFGFEKSRPRRGPCKRRESACPMRLRDVCSPVKLIFIMLGLMFHPGLLTFDGNHGLPLLREFPLIHKLVEPTAVAALTPDLQESRGSALINQSFGTVGGRESPSRVDWSSLQSRGAWGHSLSTPSPGVGPNRVIPMPAVLDEVLHRQSTPGSKGIPSAPSKGETLKADDSSQSSRGGDFYERQRRLDHEEVRQTLLKVAEEFGEEAQYVPYVWGGNQIGNTKACQACRSCIAKKSRLKVEKRKAVCKPCRQCGIDCSHFVHRVFQDAGLDFPYVNTSRLQRMSSLALLEELGLVDLGKNLDHVMPGDLLLKKKHIVVLLRAGEDGRGDVLHVSRSTQKMGPGGGIEIARDVNLVDFAGKLVKILRHRDTMMPEVLEPAWNDREEGSSGKSPAQNPAIPGSPRDPSRRPEGLDRSHPLLWGPGEFLADQSTRTARDSAG